MQIEITDKEKELHVQVIEDNLSWWMFDCGSCEDYYREICSSILLLEKLVEENYRFAGKAWKSGESFTIPELKQDYLETLKSLVEENDGKYRHSDYEEALEFVQNVFGG